MKKKDGNSFLKYFFIAIGVFVLSVSISMLTRNVLSGDTLLHLSEAQTEIVASMVEGVVSALSAGLIVYQLRSSDSVERHQNAIEEARFIFQYNQAFIQDSKMTQVENLLENEMLRIEKGCRPDLSVITDKNRQQFINYLVYNEGFAPLVLNDVLSLEKIDDLMAYRFFIAVNTPVVQQDQLFEFPEYYRGCFKLYRAWKKYREDRGYEIILPQYSLDKWLFFDYYAAEQQVCPMSDSDSKKDIAELIYRTDRYIYPAAFGTVKNARKQLPKLFDVVDSPFYRDNIRIVREKGRVAGVIVSITAAAPETEEKRKGIRLEELIEKDPFFRTEGFSFTNENYFSRLSSHLKDGVGKYIACVCVGDGFRHKGYGSLLVMYAIKDKCPYITELDVLADNPNAVSLYRKYGFETDGKEYDGFSINALKPKCYNMTLPPHGTLNTYAEKSNDGFRLYEPF